jgi:hypothetical protein
MKTLIQSCLVLLALSTSASAADVWKGHTETSPFELGLMTGMSIYGSSANWGVLASGAYLIQKDGFIDNLDNRVWAEVEMGPTFFSTNGSSHTGMQYALHLRWDFTYNEYWTFYALGGVGGYTLPSTLGGSFTIHPLWVLESGLISKSYLIDETRVVNRISGFA